MEKDITQDENLMRLAQDEESLLIGFQSVIMGVDYAVKRGKMNKNRLTAIEVLLRPYADVRGLKSALKMHKNDVPHHLVSKFFEMINKARGNNQEMKDLMYNFYFKLIYSVYYGETPPEYEETIKRIMDIEVVVNRELRMLKDIMKQEDKISLMPEPIFT